MFCERLFVGARGLLFFKGLRHFCLLLDGTIESHLYYLDERRGNSHMNFSTQIYKQGRMDFLKQWPTLSRPLFFTRGVLEVKKHKNEKENAPSC